MAFQWSKDSKLQIDNGAGAPTDVSAFVSSVSFSSEFADLDVTALGNAARKVIAGVEQATMTVDVIFDGVAAAGIDLFLDIRGKIGSVIYEPGGTATSTPDLAGEFLCTSVEITASAPELTTASASFVSDGTVTYTNNV